MARDPDLAGLPNWPRLLTRAQAASYLGLTVTGFNTGLGEGTWPDPVIPYGRIKLWDRRRLDEAVDTLSGYAIQTREQIEEDDWRRRRDAWRTERQRGR